MAGISPDLLRVMEHEAAQRAHDKGAFERDAASVANVGTHADAYIHAVNADGEELVYVPRGAPARLGRGAGQRRQGAPHRGLGRGPGAQARAQAGEVQVRRDRKPPNDAYGIRLDGERYQLGGQPPVATPTKAWGAPLVAAAKANAAAREQAWNEEVEALTE